VRYDQTTIPDSYDRSRDHGPEFLKLWMNRLSNYISSPLQTVLDLGCGTGRFSSSLSEHFHARVIGLDPSMKMLRQAQAKRPSTREIGLIQGEGGSLPLFDSSVDLIFISMVVHHFPDPLAVARECARVKRDGAPIIVRNSTRERVPTYPYVPFFPTSVPLMLQRLPSTAEVRDMFESAGLSTIDETVVEQQVANTLAEFAEKVAARGDSILTDITDAEFAAGLGALRAHASASKPSPVTERIDVFVLA
jgi:ubiquinone/menaquinone biosynthesis C-methylase UbiE